jgi:hypothetical protein
MPLACDAIALGSNQVDVEEEGGPDTFLAYEIDNIASGNDQTIHEIFADNDSGNDDEFEGFDPEDISVGTPFLFHVYLITA